jgi:hypothetical protein
MKRCRMAPPYLIKMITLTFIHERRMAVLESTNVHAEESGIYLVVERDNHKVELPKRFRMCTSEVIEDEGELPDQKGFAELRASASGQYSQRQLQTMKQSIGDVPIVLVDLRQENHGFVNGMAVNWFGLHNGANKGLSNDEVLMKERQLLDALNDQPSITFDQVKGKSVDIGGPVHDPKQILSEEQLAELEGVGYKRFFVTDHHRPSDSEVDRFVEWVKTLPAHVWLHFHCRGGVGRASTFFCMYDMMRNANEISFEPITQRQVRIGGRDFQRMDPSEAYKYGAALDRLAFMKSFYDYCSTNIEDQFRRSWSQWLEEVNT